MSCAGNPFMFGSKGVIVKNKVARFYVPRCSWKCCLCVSVSAILLRALWISFRSFTVHCNSSAAHATEKSHCRVHILTKRPSRRGKQKGADNHIGLASRVDLESHMCALRINRGTKTALTREDITRAASTNASVAISRTVPTSLLLGDRRYWQGPASYGFTTQHAGGVTLYDAYCFWYFVNEGWWLEWTAWHCQLTLDHQMLYVISVLNSAAQRRDCGTTTPHSL